MFVSFSKGPRFVFWSAMWIESYSPNIVIEPKRIMMEPGACTLPAAHLNFSFWHCWNNFSPDISYVTFSTSQQPFLQKLLCHGQVLRNGCDFLNLFELTVSHAFFEDKIRTNRPWPKARWCVELVMSWWVSVSTMRGALNGSASAYSFFSWF